MSSVTPHFPDALSPASPKPVLKIVSFKSHSTERVKEQQALRTGHIVIKSKPWEIIALLQPLPQTPHKVEMALVFDQNRNKEVVMSSDQSMSYRESRAIDSSSQAETITFETRVRVLSSQNEGQLFCVRLQVVHPQTKVAIDPRLIIFSEPIKVVSKPSCLTVKTHPTGPPKINKQPATQGICSISVDQTLGQKLEALQAGQFQILNAISSLLLPAPLPVSIVSPPQQDHSALKRPRDSLELAFYDFVDQLSALPEDERPAKLRKLSSAHPDVVVKLFESLPDEPKQSSDQLSDQSPFAWLPATESIEGDWAHTDQLISSLLRDSFSSL